jgi:hypothetical protein
MLRGNCVGELGPDKLLRMDAPDWIDCLRQATFIAS